MPLLGEDNPVDNLLDHPDLSDLPWAITWHHYNIMSLIQQIHILEADVLGEIGRLEIWLFIPDLEGVELPDLLLFIWVDLLHWWHRWDWWHRCHR